MWWLYFDRSDSDVLTSQRTAYFWGYGHYLVFSSAAAVGAGLAVSVDHVRHAAHLSTVAAGYAIAAPVAVFLLSVWVLHIRPHLRGPTVLAFPAAVALVLLTPFTPVPVQLTALVAAVLVASTIVATRSRRARD
jgi:low temperature requirement protein LtrA